MRTQGWVAVLKETLSYSSSRLSSRALGWSKIGADKMARLRIYAANGGNIYDLVKYKKEKQEREINKKSKKQWIKEYEKKENTTRMYGTIKVYQPISEKEQVYIT